MPGGDPTARGGARGGTRTLTLRNVPAPVAADLARLARGAGMTIGAFCVRELAALARRADNPAVLDALGNQAVDVAAVVEAGPRTGRTP